MKINFFDDKLWRKPRRSRLHNKFISFDELQMHPELNLSLTLIHKYNLLVKKNGALSQLLVKQIQV
jgi:hypothetical protein